MSGSNGQEASEFKCMKQGDIDKFKKMQQTTQSNRSGSKTASSVASPSRASSSRPAAEAADPMLEESIKPMEARTADPSEQTPTHTASSEASTVTEAEQEIGRLNLRSLPPNGLAKSGSGRRERHVLHRLRPSKLVAKSPKGTEDKAREGSEPAETFQGGLDSKALDVTRHGSFERDLAKLPRTRSHAKSESDLERPHQVSVTADGAGPPVTRAPLGS